MLYDIFTAFIEIPGIFIFITLILLMLKFIKDKKFYYSLLVLSVTFYAFSSGWFAKLLVFPLENKYEPLEISKVRPLNEPSIIIILGGGVIPETPDRELGELSHSAMKRVYQGFLLYQQLNSPIIVTGGKLMGMQVAEATVMKNELIKLGVEPENIFVEDQAKNTKQNAELSMQILENRKIEKVFLVSSAIHLPRAMKYFKEYDNIEIIPVPCDYLISREKLNFYDFLPDIQFLKANSSAWHEYLGLIKYNIEK